MKNQVRELRNEELKAINGGGDGGVAIKQYFRDENGEIKVRWIIMPDPS